MKIIIPYQIWCCDLIYFVFLLGCPPSIELHWITKRSIPHSKQVGFLLLAKPKNKGAMGPDY